MIGWDCALLRTRTSFFDSSYVTVACGFFCHKCGYCWNYKFRDWRICSIGLKVKRGNIKQTYSIRVRIRQCATFIATDARNVTPIGVSGHVIAFAPKPLGRGWNADTPIIRGERFSFSSKGVVLLPVINSVTEVNATAILCNTYDIGGGGILPDKGVALPKTICLVYIGMHYGYF